MKALMTAIARRLMYGEQNLSQLVNAEYTDNDGAREYHRDVGRVLLALRRMEAARVVRAERVAGMITVYSLAEAA